MYKNQLQELAQRSCFNLPSYTCIREGPDHAPRFKAAVNFNGETFECPSYCSTLRQAEHSAAEVALNALAGRGPSNSLAARILDETGVYKNLLQEVSQRVGACLPTYTTFRTGLSHLPVFTGTVELAGVIFTGEPAKNKKQAEKNAAMAAWLSLKSLLQQSEVSSSQRNHKDEQEHVIAARALQKYLINARLAGSSFPIKFPMLNPKPTNTQPSPPPTSKILPLICPKTAPPRNRPTTPVNNPQSIFQNSLKTTQNETHSSLPDNFKFQPQKFPAAGAAPYIPFRHCNPHHRMAPPVTIRNTIPVFSAQPLPPPQSSVMRPPAIDIAPPVCIRRAVPAFSSPPVRVDELAKLQPPVKIEERQVSKPAPVRVEEPSFRKLQLVQVEYPKLLPVSIPQRSEAPKVQVENPVSKISNSSTGSSASVDGTRIAVQRKLQESAEVEALKDLKI